MKVNDGWENIFIYFLKITYRYVKGLGSRVYRRQSVRHVGELRLCGETVEYEDWRTEERVSGSSETPDLSRLQRS